MKKIVLMPFACLLLMACGGQGNTSQNNENVNGDSTQAVMSTDIQGGPQTIKVNGGGQAPDIMTLL